MIHITYPVITAIALLFSLWSPLGDFIATPKFWRDEAIPFEIARTFAELGKLDVVVAPGEVDGRPYLTHATGFPLTVSLAGVFKVAGVGVRQARVFMICWILAALWFLIFFLRKLFDERAALAGALLVSTFAPFYANGRTFTGEIPGFLFLLAALYLIYKKKNYFWGGFTLAVAAVTKPSVFLLVFPVILIEFIVAERKNFWRPLQERAPRSPTAAGSKLFAATRPLLRVAAGSLPVILVWLYIILPDLFSYESWAGMLDLYRRPFNAPSILAAPLAAAKYLLTHSTVIYFALLSAAVIWTYLRGIFRGEQKRIIHFMLIYAAFSLVYFFRSPGWLRYLLISELFILMLVYPSLEEFFKARSIRWKNALPLATLLLVLAQAVNYFFFSDIPSGLQNIQTAKFLGKELSAYDENESVGIIYNPSLAALIPPHRKYQIATIGGKETYGMHPLLLPEDKMPLYLVGYNGEHKETFERFYELYVELDGGQKIFKRKQ